MRHAWTVRIAVSASLLLVGTLFLALIMHTGDTTHRTGLSAGAPVASAAENHVHEQPIDHGHGEHLDVSSGRTLSPAPAILAVVAFASFSVPTSTDYSTFRGESRVVGQAHSFQTLSVIRI